MMFEVVEESLQAIVRGGQIRNAVASEQAPLTVLDGLGHLGNHVRMLRLLSRNACQALEKFTDLSFDLPSRARTIQLIATFE